MNYKADKLRKSLGQTNGPIVVDVRSKREFRQAHIPGAIHLPFWLVPFRYNTLKAYRDRVVVVYCESGPRAVLARQSLQSKKFGTVDCLEGHMQAWRRAGYPIDKI